nr:MAG TPA: hypothetical protein [Caudoviricetes sp.]
MVQHLLPISCVVLTPTGIFFYFYNLIYLLYERFN